MTRKKTQTTTEPDPYKRSIWTWMIQYGGACEYIPKPDERLFRIQCHAERYYGNRVDISWSVTAQALDDIRTFGVDFDASSDPAEDVGRGFNGTFTETQLSFRYLAGILVSGSGARYLWGVNLPDADEMGSDSFSTVIRLIKNEPDWGTAITHLENRLTSSDEWEFAYCCKLPIQVERTYEIGE